MDESNLSCGVCFWAEHHIKNYNFQPGDVLAIINARTSSFSGKSLNCSDDTKLFLNPQSHERT